MLLGDCDGLSGGASILAKGTVPSLTRWHQDRLEAGEGEDRCVVLYALALLCFQFIISPTLWAFSSEVEVAQLTIQQADVSFAPAKYLGKQT